MVNLFIFYFKLNYWSVLASFKGNTEIVKVLLEKGANCDDKDDFGKTPLINGKLIYN